jgi:hypothetical protein
MKSTVSVKHIVTDFIHISEQLRELFNGQEQFQPIVDFILAKDYLDDDLDIPFPKLKDLEEGTGIKPYILRKLLLQMYNQIFNYESHLKLRFDKTLYHFYVKFYDQYCYFTVDKLDCLPRIGEQISLPFIKASMDINWFYVDGIKHEFEGNTQNIHLTLKVGEYNSYWRFRKDQAIEQKEIGHYDISNSRDDYELKDKVYFKKNHWNR